MQRANRRFFHPFAYRDRQNAHSPKKGSGIPRPVGGRRDITDPAPACHNIPPYTVCANSQTPGTACHMGNAQEVQAQTFFQVFRSRLPRHLHTCACARSRHFQNPLCRIKGSDRSAAFRQAQQRAVKTPQDHGRPELYHISSSISTKFMHLTGKAAASLTTE